MSARDVLRANDERFADVIAALTPQEWAAPSLCAEWSNRDVLGHLVVGCGHPVGAFLGAMIRHRNFDRANTATATERARGRSAESLLADDEAVRIRQPALLLWCRQDAVIDPSAMSLYAQRIPQARTVLLEGCGHMSLMERPREVADAVVKLIDRP